MLGITNAVETYRNFNIGVTPTYKVVNGNQYILIYKHLPQYGGWWTKGNTTTFNFNNDANKFSIMGFIDQLTYAQGIYQFRLEYPDYSASTYNEWSQTSNPLNSDNVCSSYTAIHIDWPGPSTTDIFNGIAKVTTHTSCYVKSYVAKSANWWFALFSYGNYNSTYGIPGPCGGSAGTGVTVSNVELWLRIK